MFNKNKKLSKTWVVLLSATGILFLIVGSAMSLFDNMYLQSAQHLLSAALFFMAAIKIHKKKLKKDDNEQFVYFNLGFIFTITGLGIHPGIWLFGFILFTVGTFRK